VDCVRPQLGERICDPACGTGGFLLAAHDHLVREHGRRMDKDQKADLRVRALRGVELVESVSRLCAMNLILHGIGPTNGNSDPPIRTDDSLREEPKDHFEIVLTNPPFGKKSSVTVVNEEGDEDRVTLTYRRPDFWTTTSNKQLNFVQHVRSCSGRTAAPLWSFQTTCSSREARVRRSGGLCSPSATFTRSCACRRAFSMPRA
jgi:type I restriction enzyme M protein